MPEHKRERVLRENPGASQILHLTGWHDVGSQGHPPCARKLHTTKTHQEDRRCVPSELSAVASGGSSGHADHNDQHNKPFYDCLSGHHRRGAWPLPELL